MLTLSCCSPDNSSLGTLWMQPKGAFDFSSADTVPTDIDDIIHSACDPVEAILISPTTISCEVVALPSTQAAIRDFLVSWQCASRK